MKSENLYDNLKCFEVCIWEKDTPNGSIPYFITKDGKNYGDPDLSELEKIQTLDEFLKELDATTNIPKSDESDEEDNNIVEITNQKPLNEKFFSNLDMVEEKGDETSRTDSAFTIEISASYNIWREDASLGTVWVWDEELEEVKKNPKKVFADMMKNINGYIEFAGKHTVQEYIEELNNARIVED